MLKIFGWNSSDGDLSMVFDAWAKFWLETSLEWIGSDNGVTAISRNFLKKSSWSGVMVSRANRWSLEVDGGQQEHLTNQTTSTLWTLLDSVGYVKAKTQWSQPWPWSRCRQKRCDNRPVNRRLWSLKQARSRLIQDDIVCDLGARFCPATRSELLINCKSRHGLRHDHRKLALLWSATQMKFMTICEYISPIHHPGTRHYDMVNWLIYILSRTIYSLPKKTISRIFGLSVIREKKKNQEIPPKEG
jgi:hypothetical protein